MITLALLVCLAPTAIDGDTLKCSDGTRIRIFGVNAPEVGQPGADVATANLARIIVGGLACEIRGASYSRLVGRCENAAREDISADQLKGGFAVEWCVYSKGYYGTCAIAAQRGGAR
jgi:endonuclease YncB( thermonuclease family)